MSIFFNWTLRIIAAAILLQTLFFKFTGAKESVYIFESIGAEPFGRYASGVAELIAAVLLLIPRFTWIGGLLAAGIMVGAIGTHLFFAGIVIAGDGGTLFAMAIIVLLASLATIWLNRKHVPFLKSNA